MCSLRRPLDIACLLFPLLTKFLLVLAIHLNEYRLLCNYEYSPGEARGPVGYQLPLQVNSRRVGRIQTVTLRGRAREGEPCARIDGVATR